MVRKVRKPCYPYAPGPRHASRIRQPCRPVWGSVAPRSITTTPGLFQADKQLVRLLAFLPSMPSAKSFAAGRPLSASRAGYPVTVSALGAPNRWQPAGPRLSRCRRRGGGSRCRATMHGASWQHGAPSLASATVADRRSNAARGPLDARRCRRLYDDAGLSFQDRTVLGGPESRAGPCV